MENYKEEIVSTRFGCLGGSDAKLISSVAVAGYVPKTAYKRLAVCKGFMSPDNISNRAMLYGDFVEQHVFANLKASDERWQSNVLFESKRYSRPNVKCIDHPDLLLVDDETKTVVVGEVKASKYNTAMVRSTYKEQLTHHFMLASEYAQELGNYSVKVLLCHYNTDGINLDDPFIFYPERLNVSQVRLSPSTYNIALGMDIINAFLEDFDAYYEGDEVEYQYLPQVVKNEFDTMTVILNEIKEREEKVAAFKEKLYDFLRAKDIKSIKSETFSITRVDPTEVTSFDSKKFLEDYALTHPRKVRKLRDKYKKVSKRSGYCNIRLKDSKK